ncbi:hypothetical protein [Stieleria tagensis]|uniref:hypothetical protein n=1 Tax=Stieleria tagensis TaxID=2956795 RepID=UPI00209B3599|nr:hypothetical protein [Stieleria tagensis]
MGNRFGQLDGAVHRVDLPPRRFYPALLAAIGTLDSLALFQRHIGRPGGLDHLTQTLAHFVRRDLDLIEMGRPRTLLLSLHLGGHLSGLLQQIGEFFIQLILIRIHATVSKKLPGP